MVAHSTSIAWGPTVTKKDLSTQYRVSCQAAEPFLFSIVSARHGVHNCPRALTWISSIGVMIKAPRVGYYAAVFTPRIVLLHRLNTSSSDPIPHKSCLLVLSHPRPTPLGVIWRSTTRSYTNEKKREGKRSWVSCLQVRKSFVSSRLESRLPSSLLTLSFNWFPNQLQTSKRHRQSQNSNNTSSDYSSSSALHNDP